MTEVTLELKNAEGISRGHAPDCAKCEGWGLILGTDSEASWGDPCDCGREMHIPRNHDDTEMLATAHAEARRRQKVRR
jgi:hypothetical protein